MKAQAFDNFLYKLYCQAVEGGMDLTFAAKCAGEMGTREASGRSWDCDEYRALCSSAYPEPIPPSAIADEGGCC